MNNSAQMDFAALDQNQLEQIQQAESKLNSLHPNSKEELILLAFTKQR